MYCDTYSAFASLSLFLITLRHSGEVYMAFGRDFTNDLVLGFLKSNLGLKSFMDLLTPGKILRQMCQNLKLKLSETYPVQ